MLPLFVYGTLRHLPLLEQVIGHPVPEADRRAATLRDHLARWAQGQAFPMVMPEPGALGLDEQALADLAGYLLSFR